MKASQPSSSLSPAARLPDWLLHPVVQHNGDYEQRVTCLAENAQWLDTAVAGVKIRIFELVLQPSIRLIAQLCFLHGHSPLPIGDRDLELLIQQGSLSCVNGELSAPRYYRLPGGEDGPLSCIDIRRAAHMNAQDPVLLYVATGQMLPTDTQWRCIDTTDEERWLPGPVEGISVLPLHGHGTGSVMLVRWDTSATFTTSLDPQGEELLVLEGAVYDDRGLYRQGTWIRNPIVAWQPWAAKAGTVVYYKSGHFPASIV